MQNEYIVLDFETTGICPSFARVIEVGAVRVKNNKIVDSYKTLCNPGINIPYFITEITGLTNSMVKNAPYPEDIMPDIKNFITDLPIIAHNANFDSKFLTAEMNRINHSIKNSFLCTLLLSRRLIPDLPTYKLGYLKEYIKFKSPKNHKSHRALDDVLVTVSLWGYLLDIINKIVQNKQNITTEFIYKLSKTPKSKITELLSA